MSHFSVGNYLSYSAENFRKEPFEVSEKLEYRKILCIMGWYHDFPEKKFSLKVPRSFVGEPFFSKKIMFGENMKKGCLSRFSVKNFLSYSAETVCGAHPCLSQKFRYGRKLRKEWRYHDFLSRFFCLTYRKTSWWKCCFFKNSGMVKIYE